MTPVRSPMPLRRLSAMLLVLALLVLGGTGAVIASGTMNGSFPDPARQHHQRLNCHGVYDLLVDQVATARRALTAEQSRFADAYEAAAKARTPCPAVPDAPWVLSAVNRDVLTQPAQYQLTQYVQQNDADAHYELGYVAAIGKVPGVERSLGTETLLEAARLGSAPANYLIGMTYARDGALGKRNMPAAVRHLQTAANTGHVDAIFMLGLLTAEGDVGIAKNPAKGLDYLRQAAAKGHVHATYSAASMVLMGTGVKADLDLAYDLGRNLVDNGEVVGAGIAASALLQRRDVKKHQDEILHWMAIARQHGDAKIRADMDKFRPQVQSLFNRMNATPAYVPRERNLVCGKRTTCLVDSRTGLRSCTTNTDYWNGCRRLVY